VTDFKWYSGDKLGSYGTSHEVTLLAFAYVHFAESVVGGVATVKSVLSKIIEHSQDYPGHDHPWRPPDSWRREDQDIIDKAKAILIDATSKTGNGKDLQLIESAMAVSCHLSLTHRGIEYYRERLLAGKSSKSINPLYVPSHDQKNKALRFPHLLPAVARTAMGRWGELSGLLNKALDDVPAERLQGGPGGGSPTKAAVKAAKASLEDELEAANSRADSAEKRADVAEEKSLKKVSEDGCNGFFRFTFFKYVQRISLPPPPWPAGEEAIDRQIAATISIDAEEEEGERKRS
jgi:hypothetical protein